MIPLLIWNLQQSGSRQNVQIHDHAQVFFFGLFFEGERQKKKFHFFHFSIFLSKELFLNQGKFYKSASRETEFRTIAIRGYSFVKMVVYILKKKEKKKGKNKTYCCDIKFNFFIFFLSMALFMTSGLFCFTYLFRYFDMSW